MAKISDVEIPSLLFTEGTAPSTPASGFGRLYVKTTGLFFKGDDGVEVGPLAASGGGGSAASGCRVRRTTTQSLTTGTEGAISFDTEVFDTDAYHEGVTNPTRLTAPTTAYYVVSAGAGFAAHASGTRQLAIYKNSLATGPRIGFSTVSTIGSGYATRIQVTSGIVSLTAGDYVELAALQDSGGSLNAEGNSTLDITFMSIHRIGT